MCCVPSRRFQPKSQEPHEKEKYDQAPHSVVRIKQHKARKALGKLAQNWHSELSVCFSKAVTYESNLRGEKPNCYFFGFTDEKTITYFS